MFVYQNNLSSFLDDNRYLDNPLSDFLSVFRNNLIIDTELDLNGQRINTENDLKCIIFHKVKSLEDDLRNIRFEIHSEEADKICINDDYCDELTEPTVGDIVGDIKHQNTTTRTTDLTITINPVEGQEIGIRKGYSRFGNQIDIELKYIRKGFNTQYLRDIGRDLCKLKYVVDPDIEHHNGTAPSCFGLFCLGFREERTLLEYLDKGLREKIENFNQLSNVAVLLFYREV